jgi:NADH-quinone oxidoreductase subunit H
MFLKKLNIKKVFYGILFVISSFSYIGWLSFDSEKKKDLLNLSLNFNNSEVVKVLPIYTNNVNSLRIDEFKTQYGHLFSLTNNNTDVLSSIIFDLELYAQNLNSYTILELLEKENNSNYMLSFIIHYVLSSLFLIIGLLIAVAYFTLLERKAMASMQRRKGPNVVGFWGLLQPLADGLKLLAKEIVIPRRASITVFIGSPLYTFLMSLMGWCVIPWSSEVVFADPRLSALYVFAVSSLGVYGVLLAGWSSNSKYAFLGGLRSAAQMISYEVSLGFILVIVALFSGTYNLREIVFKQETVWYCFPLFPLVLIFFVSMLAETNRAPFDLPEAEAELVSGYNTEYSSIIFAMFFLGEYSSMLLMAAIMVIFFFGGWLPPLILHFELFESFWFFIKITFIAFSYVWVRATLPRYRYNQLMSIGWKIFLPVTFGLLLFYAGILILFDGLPVNSDYGTFIVESGLSLRDKKEVFLMLKDITVN